MIVTPMDWLLLAVCFVLCLMIVFLRHIIRGLEKRTDVLEKETEWVRQVTVMSGESPSRYDHTIQPLTLTMPAVVDDQEYTKKVPFRFVEGDTATPSGYKEDDDPLPGLPKRYG